MALKLNKNEHVTQRYANISQECVYVVCVCVYPWGSSERRYVRRKKEKEIFDRFARCTHSIECTSFHGVIDDEVLRVLRRSRT